MCSNRAGIFGLPVSTGTVINGKHILQTSRRFHLHLSPFRVSNGVSVLFPLMIEDLNSKQWVTKLVTEMFRLSI